MTEQILRSSLTVLALDELDPLGVDAFVTTRDGGVSKGPYASLNLALHVGDEVDDVLVNRTRLAQAAGCELSDLVFMDQIHGARVASVGNGERGRGAFEADHALSATDAVVTTTPELSLVVLVADCAPVVLVDPEHRVLGVAHAGWRGVAADVLGATVRAMEALGAHARSLRCVIGPTISPARYEVGDEVLDALARELGSLEGLVDLSKERPHLDVAQAARRSLLHAGVPDDAVTITAERSDDEAFFSARRGRPCGRFGLVACLVG